MKVNKIILRICHFFGFRKNEAHFDDVKIYIPTQYDNMNHYAFEFTNQIVDDIKEQTYRELEKNVKLKKWCTRTKQIWVIFPNQLCKVFNYIDGTLYWPGLDDVAAERANKLSKILDEK
jgi:hypothetical protein